MRVIDLFRSWDEDGNGTITQKMRKAITALGSTSKDDFMDLFRQLDTDGGGSIEYKELHKVLGSSLEG